LVCFALRDLPCRALPRLAAPCRDNDLHTFAPS
jgi:hypothetical protein